jgi:hypothetical protein
MDGLLVTPADPRRYLIFMVPVFLLFCGIYGFWRIPQSYQVKQILSTKSIEEKKLAVHSFLEPYKITWKHEEMNYISVRYRNKLFTHIEARFYFDEHQVLFNAEGADIGGLKGIIDFGIGKKTMKKLKTHLLACL